MLQRYLIVWLILLTGTAYVWPSLAWLAFDPFMATKGYLWPLIGVAMLAIGWMLPREEVLQVIRRWPLVLTGTAIQFTTMPLVAFLVARGGGFSGDWLTGLIIVGCVPGAMASNVLTLIARGNVSYSLSLTTSATLLSPVIVPVTLYLALGRSDVRIDYAGIIFQLVYYVVFPVVAGHLLARAVPHWESGAKRIGSTVANLAILWIIAVVVAVNREKIAGLGSDIAPAVRLIGALALINGLGYLSGYGSGAALKFPEPMRRALTLEIGMQNAGLGATLAASAFAAEAAIPPALYMFGCMLTGTILARMWASSPKDEHQARDK